MLYIITMLNEHSRKFYEGPLESLPLAFHRDDESLLCEDCKKKHSEGTVLDSFCLKCSKLSYAQYKKVCSFEFYSCNLFKIVF